MKKNLIVIEIIKAFYDYIYENCKYNPQNYNYVELLYCFRLRDIKIQNIYFFENISLNFLCEAICGYYAVLRCNNNMFLIDRLYKIFDYHGVDLKEIICIGESEIKIKHEKHIEEIKKFNEEFKMTDNIPFVAEKLKILSEEIEKASNNDEKRMDEIKTVLGEFDLLKEAQENKIFENKNVNSLHTFYDYVIKGDFLKTLTSEETLFLFTEKTIKNSCIKGHGFRSISPNFKIILESYEKVCFFVCEFKFNGLSEFYAIGFPYSLSPASFENGNLETGLYTMHPTNGVFNMIEEKVNSLDYHLNLIDHLAICEKILYNRAHSEFKT